MGGLHVTSLPQEAASHADTIFIGPGEDTWPVFLDDFRRGEPRSCYTSTERSLTGLPPVRRDLIQRHRYLVPNSIVVTRVVRTTATSATRTPSSKVAAPSIPRPWTRHWRRLTGCPAGTCTSSTTTCWATGASPRRCSRAWPGWG